MAMTTSTPLPKQVLCPVDDKPAPWVENKEKYGRNFVDGKPAGYVWRYDSAKEKYTAELETLGEYELNQRAITWLMQSIGSLVMKGYLKVTPMIELGD